MVGFAPHPTRTATLLLDKLRPCVGPHPGASFLGSDDCVEFMVDKATVTNV